MDVDVDKWLSPQPSPLVGSVLEDSPDHINVLGTGLGYADRYAQHRVNAMGPQLSQPPCDNGLGLNRFAGIDTGVLLNINAKSHDYTIRGFTNRHRIWA
jgi:hypothetical protein